MISFIKGSVVHISQASIILECNGIGYEIYASTSTIAKISLNTDVKIYTLLSIRDDSLMLYGFLTPDEIEIFNRLITVAGMGPKGSLNMLSVLTPEQITLAIVTEDFQTLSKAPGVGKKIAQRIVIDLKDKIKTGDIFKKSESEHSADQTIQAADKPVLSGFGSYKQDAIDALITLGYTRSESVKAVLEAAANGMNTEQIIKASLRKLTMR